MIHTINNPAITDVNSFVKANEPAIFTNTSVWFQKASILWKNDYLVNKLGEAPVSVVYGKGKDLIWDPKTGLGAKKVPFTDALEDVYTKGAYIQEDVSNVKTLRQDFWLPPTLSLKPASTLGTYTARKFVRTKLWIGGSGLKTPLHYDPVDTFHWVVKGSKVFNLCPPGVRKYSPYGMFSEAPFISRKTATEVGGEEVLITAGEILYIPAYWWHEVDSIGTTNISLNFVWMPGATKSLCHPLQWARCWKHTRKQLRRAQAARAAAELGR